MELSAVLTLRDKLSGQMEKAGKSVSAMTAKVNESRDAIARISAAQNIQISANSNIAEVVSAAKASITSLQSTVGQKELALQGKLDFDGLESETINAKLNELGNFLDKNAGKVEAYGNKLAVLKQKQAEFSDGTKGNVKLGVEQSIESLQNKLAEIEAAKQQFAEWQQIRLDFNDLEVARAELATLENAVESLNNTNVAVKAYLDFKTDALKQVYDIDNELKSIGQEVISPVIKLKDQATAKINGIKERTRSLAQEKCAPVISAVDKSKSILSNVRTGLAKIAGTVAYPIIKVKDTASKVITPVKAKLEALGKRIITPEVKLKAQQVFSTIKEIEGKLAGLSAKAGKALAGATAKIGKGLAVSVGSAAVALGGIGAASINVGAQFEASMSQVAATMGMTADEANYSNETFAKLANTAKQMGASTKFSASEAGEALNYLALAGYTADQAVDALPTILNLAAAGGMDLAAASDMVTDSMSALGIAATDKNLTNFGDQLAKTAQKSNTSVAQLGEAILTVGGTAKTLAGGTTELNALLGIIADNGVKGSEGGTALRNVMLSLQAPTDNAAKALKSLGVSVYDAQGKMRPMNEVLGDLNASMDHMTDAEKQNVISTIFNKNDLKSVNALLANCGDRFDELSGYIEDSDGAMAAMAETMNDNLQGRVTEFKSAMEGAGIAIYEALGSGNLKDLVKEASGWIGDLTKATEEGGIDGLVGAVGSVFAKVVTKISSMTPQIVKSGVKIVSSLISGIKDNIPQISGGIVEAGTIFVQGIFQLVPELLLAGGSMVMHLAQGVAEQIPQLLDSGAAAIEKLAQGMVDGSPMMANVMVQVITNLSGSLNQNLQPMLESALQILMALVQGITQAIPVLLPAVVQVITGLVQFISENLDTIIMAALGILMALVQGIIDSIPVLIPAIVDVVLNIVQFLTDNLPMIMEAALNIMLALIQGMTENIPLLVDGVIQIITGLVTFITQNLPTLIMVAIQMVFAINQGLIEAIPTLIEGALQLVSSIWDIIMSTDWLQLGIDIILGIGKGLISGVASIAGTIKEAAGSIVNKFKDKLQIHSPSKIMEDEVGYYAGAGIAEGLKDTKSMVNREVDDLASGATVTLGANMSDMKIPQIEPYELPEPETPKYPVNPDDPSGGSDAYKGMDIAQPLDNQGNSINNSYAENTENNQEVKKYYVEKIIENVNVTGDGDEDRLVEKILSALADDIEETADNMGEDES